MYFQNHSNLVCSEKVKEFTKFENLFIYTCHHMLAEQQKITLFTFLSLPSILVQCMQTELSKFYVLTN